MKSGLRLSADGELEWAEGEGHPIGQIPQVRRGPRLPGGIASRESLGQANIGPSIFPDGLCPWLILTEGEQRKLRPRKATKGVAYGFQCPEVIDRALFLQIVERGIAFRDGVHLREASRMVEQVSDIVIMVDGFAGQRRADIVTIRYELSWADQVLSITARDNMIVDMNIVHVNF